jgi:hypothetical protein
MEEISSHLDLQNKISKLYSFNPGVSYHFNQPQIFVGKFFLQLGEWKIEEILAPVIMVVELHVS